MTLRIVADVREDGTTIRLIGRMRAEHIAPVREEISASRAPTALDLDEVTLTDIDAVRFLRGCRTRWHRPAALRAVHSRMDRERVRKLSARTT